MATESKLGAEQQNKIGKGSQGREHVSEGEREHESERESTRERKKRATERASARGEEKPAAGAGARVAVPAHRRGEGDRGPTTGTNEKRSEQKTKEETWRPKFWFSGSVAYSWMNKGRCHGLTIIFSLLVSGGSPIQDRFGNTPTCNKALFVNKPHTYQKKKHPYFIIPSYALTMH